MEETEEKQHRQPNVPNQHRPQETREEGKNSVLPTIINKQLLTFVYISDENWPPWVTAKPENNDIVMDEDQQSHISDATRQTIQTPSFNAAPRFTCGGHLHLKLLLIATVVRFLILL